MRTKQANKKQLHLSDPEDHGLRVPIQETFDALVLDADERQSLVSVRSLGSRNLRVVAAENIDGVPAFSSKWCLQKAVFQAESGAYSYLEHLQQLLTATGAKVLITSSDATIALIRRHRQKLEQLTHIALAKEPALSIAVNKNQTLEIARKLGLLIPKGVHIASSDDVDAAIREVGLPAVVKPVESRTSNDQEGARFGAQLVTTVQEARLVVETMTRFGGGVLFQQFLDGRREAISFV